ncbi:hypothetical protein [Pseudoflavonifractor phocaeensis]|uniref:hypothetical protein n=1 Tax=Pseudoflavonifractor phocaeensis TaxID=1870988 RepID=UPI00195C232C|nr:hypothetical protein [Pseudoflavonifractor phocaeensis]MBM6925964.1 hypothetical protein [Pseudoflavonifractor phocaeensis]
MRRSDSLLLCLGLLVSLTACGSTPTPEIVVTPPVQEIKSEAQLTMEAILVQYMGRRRARKTRLSWQRRCKFRRRGFRR